MNESLDAHDGLVEVVVHRQLEALARLQVVRVVERLGVQEHVQPVGLANLCKETTTRNINQQDACGHKLAEMYG